MPILPNISGPRDLDALSLEQLEQLAAEIREFLIENVSRTGGHLGPNLGVVELTLAMHKVFDSPNDPMIFDTGHQSYVHKLLTGRQDFSGLRSRGGLAGYPQRSESPHDVVESSHASSSLSWADGVSRALTRTGRKDRHVIAVVGDGSLTGGMTWEALNNISDDNDRNLVIIVNDNGRSYAPTIGGMARYLNRVRTADTTRPCTAARIRCSASWARRHVRSTAECAAEPTGSSRGSRTTPRCIPISTSSTSGRSTGTTCRCCSRPSSSRRTSGRPSSCTRSPRRAAAISPPGTTRPTSSTRSGASIRSRASPSEARPRPHGRMCSPMSSSPSARSGPTSSRSRRRCSGPRACCPSPSGSPIASTTWASPSSMRWPPPPVWRSAACTPSWRSTRHS